MVPQRGHNSLFSLKFRAFLLFQFHTLSSIVRRCVMSSDPTPRPITPIEGTSNETPKLTHKPITKRTVLGKRYQSGKTKDKLLGVSFLIVRILTNYSIPKQCLLKVFKRQHKEEVSIKVQYFSNIGKQVLF